MIRLFLFFSIIVALPIYAQEPSFEEIEVEDSGVGEPDSIGSELLSNGSNDIGEPDALGGANGTEVPSTIEGGDVTLDLDVSLPSGDEAADVPETFDLSLPTDTVSEQTLSVPSRGPTGPNFDKESYFNRVYRQFNEKPLSIEEWSQISLERKGEVYQVQKGDTLWDISITFFGDGQYWPKIWSLNQSITNPHKIEPQHELVFFPGNLIEEPRMEVDQQEETVVAEEKVDTKPLKGVVIPEPSQKPTKLINIPSSLPFLRTFILEKQDFRAPTVGSVRPRTASNRLEVLTYYEEVLPQAVGEVVEVEFGGKTAAQFQYVNIKFDTAPVQGNLLAIKAVDTFYHPEDDEKAVGHIIQIQGILQTAEPVNGAQNIYRAMITRSTNPVEVGAKVISGSISTLSTTMDRTAKAVSGAVFGGRFEKSRQLFGTGGTLFISAGANQGVSVGDIISIVANRSLRNPKTVESENFRKIALAKAIYVTGGVTTAYVLSSDEAVRVGDFSGLAAAGLFPGGGGSFEDDAADDGFSEESSGDFSAGGDSSFESEFSEGEEDSDEDFSDF